MISSLDGRAIEPGRVCQVCATGESTITVWLQDYERRVLDPSFGEWRQSIYQRTTGPKPAVRRVSHTEESFPLVTRILAIVAFLLLLLTIWPLWQFWRAMGNSALRSTCIWAGLAAAFWTLVFGLAVLEPEPGRWIWLGFLRLLATTLLLTPIVAVLGARRPGEVAWNLIVLSSLVVFTLPVLEQWLLGKPLESDRVGMDGPRLTFFAIVATVGIVNYLPTRFGFAVLVFGASLAVQLAAIGPWKVGSAATVAALGSVAALLASAAIWLAFALRLRPTPNGSDGAWLAFRDGWGLVWATRLRDRWNASAEHNGWNMRLRWSGFARFNQNEAPIAEEMAIATEQFALLLRRFVDPADWFPGSPMRGTSIESDRKSSEGPADSGPPLSALRPPP